MSEELSGEIWQGGICVAAVNGTDERRVMAELARYVSQYAKDGPLEVRGNMAKRFWNVMSGGLDD